MLVARAELEKDSVEGVTPTQEYAMMPDDGDFLALLNRIDSEPAKQLVVRRQYYCVDWNPSIRFRAFTATGRSRLNIWEGETRTI